MVDDKPFLIIFVALYAVFAAIRVYYRSRPTVRERPKQGRREGIDRIGGPAGVDDRLSKFIREHGGYVLVLCRVPE